MTPRSLNTGRWARAKWLVLAPHPDDETLGVGALIGDVAAAGRLAGVVYLTDGAGSHPAGVRRLVATRRAEATIALHRLAGRAVPITWIGWPDGQPETSAGSRHAVDAGRFAALLRRLRVDAIAVTAANEPHCDHAAAYRFAAAAAARARRSIALFAYHVWSDPPAGARHAFHSRAMPAGHRRHALRAHRSQLTPALGPGFRLAPERQRMATRDIIYLQRIFA